MRAFIDVLRFELRLHGRSPLFWGVALLFFALNLLTLTRTGINLGDNEKIALNSPWLIFMTQLVLGIFGMLPALVFAVSSMTRDAERGTTELFFATPVPPRAFLLGRFAAGTLAAFAIGILGLLGALAGPLMPWLDATRLLPFDWRPWVASLVLLVLPNLFVFCAIFFSVAVLTRSLAVTIGAALGVLVLDVFINVAATPPASRALQLADPMGALSVAEVSRYWTVTELNSQLPTALLLPNRLLWLAVASALLLVATWRFRMELSSPVARPLWMWRRSGVRSSPALDSTPVLAPAATRPVIQREPRFDAFAAFRQFLAQLRMDWRGVWQSPLYWLVLALAGLAVWGEASNLKSPLADLPMYPSTALMLDFFRYSLFQYLLLAIVYFSALLVFRERDCGVESIAAATPFPDWVPVVSKTLVLCAIVLLLLAASAVVSLAVQEAADFHAHQPGVLLQGVLVYGGFQFLMFSVLAVFVQSLSPGKWSGMVIVLLVFVAVLALPLYGVEHLLLGFRIPAVVYSDMNGFGHFRVQTWSLVAYWGAFCVLLLAAGHLLYPRGQARAWRERLRDAGTRVTAPLLRACAAAAIVFAGAGAFIFYNTNVLNDYVPQGRLLAEQARYEREFGRHRDAPVPSITDPDLHLELYPAQRRIASRGSYWLRNNKPHAIDGFLLSVDHRGRVGELVVEGASLEVLDAARNLHWVRPDIPLAPGARLKVRWAFTRENRGFPNASPDNEIVGNGSYVRTGLVPVPGYCTECEIGDGRNRKRFGLPPAARLPVLGDPAHLNDLFPGLDSRSSFHVVVGTEIDQVAVVPGDMARTWEQDGRRYFEYVHPGPIWPVVTALTARYEVAREDWNGIALEIYHEAKHPWNIRAMLDSAKLGLDYYSREFAPYPHRSYRMSEYARYSSRVQAGVGSVAYAEGSGFMSDLRGRTRLDMATLHELAHQWWGNDVYGARMQGRQVLNEGLAQYSTFMVYRHVGEMPQLHGLLRWTHNSYLAGRKGDAVGENPVVKADDQPHLAYGKAALSLYALQDLIGADKVNGALRAYHARFVDMKPPFPTTLDLVHELRAAAGPAYQQLITDLFERIVLYDVSVTAATAVPVEGGHDLVLDVEGRQFAADSQGAETEEPLDTWFQVAVFPEPAGEVGEQAPMYLQYHRLRSGPQRITVRVAGKPGTVGIDPYHLMIDRLRGNNVLQVSAKQ